MKALQRETVGVPETLIAQAIAWFGEAYQRRVTAETAAVYLQACGDAMTPGEWRAVVREALERCESWPTPAALLRLLRELREGRADVTLSPDELEAEQREWDRAHGSRA